MRLIDADAYQEVLEDLYRVRVDWRNDTSDERRGLDVAMCALAEAPTIDAVPVVRCGECKHRFVDGDNVRYNVCTLNHNKVQPDDWFCADGERKDGADSG
jgi:hypothetical protein